MPSAEGLFASHHRDLVRYFARMIGRPDEADDLAQEVFVRVVRALQNGGPVGHERGWVFAIARNLVVDRHRHEQRQVPTVDDVEPATAAVQGLGLDLEQSIVRLPVPEREAFLLKEVGGLSYDEIGAACECTADSVRARLHRARMALRHMLDPLGTRTIRSAPTS